MGAKPATSAVGADALLANGKRDAGCFNQVVFVVIWLCAMAAAQGPDCR